MTINRTLARRYALAVYELAAERDAVDRIRVDLERILSTIEGDATTREFFLAPVIDRYAKERVFTKAFEGRVDDVAFHTLLLLVRKHREPLLSAILEEYRAFEMAASGLEPLTIASARPLSRDELESVTKRIEKIYGRAFEARVVVNPALIGGMRITMGDRLVDGTIEGRLEELARTLEPATTP